MFKSSTWRSEKKIKAVFKMKFQATQVPKLKAKTLMISLVPVDVGKPTVRLRKAPILEGTCSWENPVYETVKLVKETKTGKYRGKIYHFIVSRGSSKAGLLGEASVDFVDFLEAANPVMLSLPLEATSSGAILHVTIQKWEGTLDERYMEEDVNPAIGYCNGNMQLEESDNFKNNHEYIQGERPNRITTQTQSQDNISRASQEYITTNVKTPEKVALDVNVPRYIYQRYPDCSLEDSSDGSVIDTTNSPTEKYAMDKTELPTDDVGRMNTQIKMLTRQAEVSELELQSLRRHMAKESKKVQELSGRIVALKQERDTLQTECEQLKTSLKSIQEQEVSNSSLLTTENLSNVAEEINQELSRQKHLNKKLKYQLQKTEDSNSELILTVRDLKEEVNQKNKELCHLSAKVKANQNEPKALADVYMYEMGEKEETKEKGTVRQQKISDEAELLKQELANLSNELELSKKEKEELKQYIQQLTLDYETVKKEKGDVYSDLQQKKIANMEMQHEYSDSLTTMKQLKLQEESLKQEIKKQALLHSESLATIDYLKTEVKSLEKKLKRETKDSQEKLTEVSQAKVEQEQRAIRAEEALRNANWSKTKVAERLREEFRMKSEEMTSKINENEKLAMQSVAETNELRLQNEVFQKLLQKANDELQLHKDESENHSQNAYRDPIQQKTGLANDNAPEKKGKGEYTRSGELDNGSTAEIEFCKAQSERNESHSRRELETGKPHAYSSSDLAKLINEIASLKEGNKHMAVELIEMQERYSEISLKFAEVEGERQELVMTLRNLRNGKKT